MRKGCEGTIAFQEIGNKKDFLQHFQDKALEIEDDEKLEFYMQTVAEIKYDTENPQELIKWFLEQVKRYLFFKECTDFKKLFEEKLGINPRFAEKIQKGRFNFSPLRIQLRFPSAKTKFSMPKWRDPFLLARGEDGLVRIWKRDKKHNYLLLNEIGEKGAGSGAFDLCSEDYLFYSYGKGVKVYFWRNSALVKDIKFEMPVNDISSEKHSVRIMFDNNQAQKMEIKNGEPAPSYICRPVRVPVDFAVLEPLIRGDIINVAGTLYFIPHIKADKTKCFFRAPGSSEEAVELLAQFYEKKKITFFKEKDVTLKDLILKKMLNSSEVELENNFQIILNILQLKKMLNSSEVEFEDTGGLVPVSENPEVEICGLERFDDYLIFGFKENAVKIYDRQGNEKVCLQMNKIMPEEFRMPEKDVELRVFEDGFLLMKGNDSVYGSKNRYDYIYVTDGYNVYFPDMEEYKEYFDYIEYEPLFDEILKGSWKKKEKKTINKKSPLNVSEKSSKPDMTSPVKFKLRHEPVSISRIEYKKIFNLNDSGMPLRYIPNFFVDNENGTISDLATGLMWQKQGSSAMTFAKAVEYCTGINRKGFAGYNDWRIPTVNELLSLFEFERQSNGLYINPLFDKKQQWCWSSDNTDHNNIFYVNFNAGSVAPGAINSSNYVRLVRTIK